LLSKCANPACLARFRTLRHGRLFRVEIKAVSSGSAHPSSRIEYFWLCGDCARVMKLVWHNGVVGTRPKYLALTAGAGM